MLEKISQYSKECKNIASAESPQFFLWLPVLYAAGILIYLSFPFEPWPYAGTLFAASCLLITVALRTKRRAFYFLTSLFFIMAGFSGANIRAILVKAPILEKELHGVNLQAKIVEIDTYKSGHRIFLSDIKSDKISAEKMPKIIRITALTNINDVKAGDIISARVALSPPPKAVLPDTYDFSKNAYFQQIGAVGFAVSDFVKIKPAYGNFDEKIQQIRNTISKRLEYAIDGLNAEIAKALFVGDTGGIDKNTMVSIRNSGLAHLLSISGLHMVIICAICFKICRLILALSSTIALNYNTKKFAAICAIIGSYFYLLISGNPVPAQRSFIMSAMVFLAMVFDRSGTPLRIVAIAALYILVITPENIIYPSFEMSFAAVIGLISAFGYLKPHLNHIAATLKIPPILMAILGTIISSLVATAATAPFAIYHFNRNSPYGILANIIAIPITSFLAMPLGIMTIILMPFHLEWLLAWPLSTSIDLIVWVANYFSALPYANSVIPGINDWQLLAISLGFLWLSLWKTKLRLFGLIFVFIAVIAAVFNKTPDIIINNDASIFAVKDENGELLFSTDRGSKYVKDVWIARVGQEEAITITNSNSKIIQCDNAGCIYNTKGYVVNFIKHPIALASDCSSSDIFINMTSIKYNCHSAKMQINLFDLKKNGGYEFYLGKKIDLVAVINENHRLWN